MFRNLFYLFFLSLFITSTNHALEVSISYDHLGKSYYPFAEKDNTPVYDKNGKNVNIPKGGTWKIETKRKLEYPEFALVDDYFITKKYSLDQKSYLVAEENRSYLYTYNARDITQHWELENLHNSLLFSAWIYKEEVRNIQWVPFMMWDNYAHRLKISLKIDPSEKEGFPVLILIKNNEIQAVTQQNALHKAILNKNLIIDKKALKIFDHNKNNLAHIAALHGRKDIIQQIIESKGPFKKKNKLKATALHFAARAGRNEIIKQLINAGVDGSQQNQLGDTALHIATFNGDATILKELAQKQKWWNKYIKKENNDKLRPIHIAINRNHYECYEMLKNEDDNILTDTEIKNINKVLGKKAHMGQIGFVKDLIHYAEKESFEIELDSILDAALQNGNSELVQFLIDKGANPKARNKKGIPFLDIAAYHGNAEAIEVISPYEQNINRLNAYDLSPLHLAINSNKTEAVEAMFRAGASPDFENQKGQSPLLYAMQNGHQDIAKTLIKHGASCKIDKNSIDELLSMSILHNSIETLRESITECVDPSYKVYGQYPLLWLAQYYENEDAEKLLLEYGASIDESESPEFIKSNTLKGNLKPLHLESPKYSDREQQKYGDFEALVSCVVDKSGKVIFPKIIHNPVASKNTDILQAMAKWKFETPKGNVKLRMPVRFKAEDKNKLVFSIAELASPPTYRKRVAPTHPSNLLLEGKVVVDCIIDESGNVISTKIQFSTHPGFSKAALKAVKKWKFYPGIVDGKPVKFRVTIPLNFHLN